MVGMTASWTGLQSRLHCLCVLQKRALETYVKRTYHPFMQRLPSWHQLPCGLVVLWTHSQPSLQRDKHLLGTAVVVPSLQELQEALTALPQLVSEQGEMLLWQKRCCC